MREIEVNWRGPYRWPGVDGDSRIGALEDAPEASLCGVYLWTVEYQEKHLIYAAGQTQRPFLKRLREHSTAHRNGFFTVFDMEAMRQGKREEVWHGFFTKKRSPDRKEDFFRRKTEIQEAIENQLATFRVFLGPLEPEPRLLARMEAGIMDSLYAAPPPFSTIPDQGMSLSRRWASESPVVVRNVGADSFHVMPEIMQI